MYVYIYTSIYLYVYFICIYMYTCINLHEQLRHSKESRQPSRFVDVFAYVCIHYFLSCICILM